MPTCNPLIRLRSQAARIVLFFSTNQGQIPEDQKTVIKSCITVLCSQYCPVCPSDNHSSIHARREDTRRL